MKKVIAFDLDETLTETTSLITNEMSELLGELLKKFQVCVISGGSFDSFKKQFLTNLHIPPDLLSRLHLMPTCGTRYYRYAVDTNEWRQVYAEDLTEEQKRTISTALDEAARESGYKIDNPKGPLIDDRTSQITYVALGRDAQPAEKKAWDPDGTKKLAIRDLAAKKLPEFEVRVGGTTSIDVTKPGIDKAYGMKKLCQHLGINKEDILFIGDRVFEGGNDYPVQQMGIECVAVDGYEQTPVVVRKILSQPKT